MPAFPTTHNERAPSRDKAEGATCFVFRTTPLPKEQTHVSCHISRAPVKARA